jgi:hypothetical protein
MTAVKDGKQVTDIGVYGCWNLPKPVMGAPTYHSGGKVHWPHRFKDNHCHYDNWRTDKRCDGCKNSVELAEGV